MLATLAEFPHVGSLAYFDDRDAEGRDVVEQVRILRDNGDGSRLVSLLSHRYSHEAASGNRTVPTSALRATEMAAPVKSTPVKPARQRKARGK